MNLNSLLCCCQDCQSLSLQMPTNVVFPLFLQLLYRHNLTFWKHEGQPAMSLPWFCSALDWRRKITDKCLTQSCDGAGLLCRKCDVSCLSLVVVCPSRQHCLVPAVHVTVLQATQQSKFIVKATAWLWLFLLAYMTLDSVNAFLGFYYVHLYVHPSQPQNNTQ